MGKLKGTALKTVKDYVTSVRKSSDKNVYFVCRSNDGGVAVREVIRTVFKPEKVTRYNYDLEGFISPFGISHWREFRAKFNTKSAADECYKEVNAAINASYNEDVVEDDPYFGGSVSNSTSTSTGNSILGGNSTYIIIGAAAIIILLILWNSKRK